MAFDLVGGIGRPGESKEKEEEEEEEEGKGRKMDLRDGGEGLGRWI